MNRTVRVKVKGTYVTLMFPINFTTERVLEVLELVFERKYTYNEDTFSFHPVGERPEESVFQTVKVRSASGISELPFPISMTSVGVCHYLANMLNKEFTYNERTGEYVMAEEEPLPITVAVHLRNISEEAREIEHEQYVERILAEATKAAAKGAEKAIVPLEPEAYHCREKIGYVLRDKGFCVQTEMADIPLPLSADREIFIVKVDWSRVQVTAPYHKDKED